MVYDLTHEIIYQPRRFGIYGIESLRVVECVYAIQHSRHAGIDASKSFLIKTGRKPNKLELDYIERVKNGEKAPFGVYQHNWVIYSSQNLLLKHPHLLPSTKEIKDITEKTFGHSVDYKIVNLVAAVSENKVYSLHDGFYGVNVWQLMGVCCSLDCLKINRDDSSIRFLFNKIYKREPKTEEITVCKCLKITTPQEIQDEIEQIIKVRNKRPVSSRRTR